MVTGSDVRAMRIRREEEEGRRGAFEREGGFILLAICKSMD